MSKKVLLATEKPFSASAMDQVAGILKDAGYEVALLESYADKAALLEAVSDVDALIIRSDQVDAEVLEAAKALKLVVRAGAGYDNIDCAKAKERGVLAMNTPGQNANAVAELVISLMVHMARNKWNGKPGTELRGKTLGIHALGAVGRAVTTIAQGFGMQVIAFDPFVDASKMKALGVEPISSVETLYQRSQYVSLHMPKTKETVKSVGRSLLGLLPKGGTVVNTARSEVIHEQELLEMMAERSDLRYITDIQPSPEIHQALTERFADRYFATPKKLGAQTLEANVNAGLAAARQIVAFFEKGIRDFVVNP